jgi:hypothetical protein
MPNKNDDLAERIVRDIRDLLLANITPTGNLSDDRTADRIRSIVGGPELRRALEQANDTALCFAVREIRRVLSDKPQSRALLNRLWEIMDRPEINQALGINIKQNSPGMLWWKKPSTR